LRQRHRVLGLLGVLSVLTFMDRLAIAVAGPQMQHELRIQPQAWGWILSAYVLANGIFEIPSGASGDRHGQRRELTRIVTWWSAFTALTAACRGFWQLIAVRFLFGMGTAGAYPNSAGVIARWFPPHERARSQGVVWSASRLGGALAPLIIVPMEQRFGWRSAFWLLGGLGFAWAIIWFLLFRDDPSKNGAVSQVELEEIGVPCASGYSRRIPWTRLFRSRPLWTIAVAYGCYGCASWFYFSWFPTWMAHATGMAAGSVILTSVPFLAGSLCNLAGGLLADRLSLRFGSRTVLRAIPTICLGCATLMLTAMALIHATAAAVILSSVGFGMMDLMLPSAWAICIAIGGNLSGTATGIMNTAGQAGGFVATVLYGYIVQLSGSYSVPIFFIAGMVLISAALFSQIDASHGLDAEEICEAGAQLT
jgi:MFS family permease